MGQYAYTSEGRRSERQLIEWWRRVDDPAEAEWLRTTVRGRGWAIPVCGDCRGRVEWVERYHAYACTGCDMWMQPKCPKRCERCAARPRRPARS